MLRKLISTNSFANSHKAIWNVRLMSQYAPDFKDPIIKKEDQDQLKADDEFKSLAHTRIKAARSDFSSSLLQDPTVSRFLNYILRDGRKVIARDILEKGFRNIKRIQLERYHLAKSDEEKEGIELNPRVLLVQAIENCRPVMRLIKVKRGGTNYNVPIPITVKRSYFTSMKWLLDASNDKAKEMHFPEKFAWEVIDAAHNTGRVIKRKQDLHKDCEANRAYAHYRWIN